MAFDEVKVEDAVRRLKSIVRAIIEPDDVSPLEDTYCNIERVTQLVREDSAFLHPNECGNAVADCNRVDSKEVVAGDLLKRVARGARERKVLRMRYSLKRLAKRLEARPARAAVFETMEREAAADFMMQQATRIEKLQQELSAARNALGHYGGAALSRAGSSNSSVMRTSSPRSLDRSSSRAGSPPRIPDTAATGSSRSQPRPGLLLVKTPSKGAVYTPNQRPISPPRDGYVAAPRNLARASSAGLSVFKTPPRAVTPGRVGTPKLVTSSRSRTPPRQQADGLRSRSPPSRGVLAYTSTSPSMPALQLARRLSAPSMSPQPGRRLGVAPVNRKACPI